MLDDVGFCTVRLLDYKALDLPRFLMALSYKIGGMSTDWLEGNLSTCMLSPLLELYKELCHGGALVSPPNVNMYKWNAADFRDVQILKSKAMF